MTALTWSKEGLSLRLFVIGGNKYTPALCLRARLWKRRDLVIEEANIRFRTDLVKVRVEGNSWFAFIIHFHFRPTYTQKNQAALSAYKEWVSQALGA